MNRLIEQALGEGDGTTAPDEARLAAHLDGTPDPGVERALANSAAALADAVAAAAFLDRLEAERRTVPADLLQLPRPVVAKRRRSWGWRFGLGLALAAALAALLVLARQPNVPTDAKQPQMAVPAKPETPIMPAGSMETVPERK